MPRISGAEPFLLSRESHHEKLHPHNSAVTIPLVCRRWLNVCTPLIYEAVLLRTRQQVRCLARTLVSDYTLGRNIRRLKIEGGMGVPVNKILHFTPNVTHLLVELVGDREDSTLGLRLGLESINPERVTLLHRTIPRYNRRMSPLVGELCEYIPKWTNLTTLRYPYNRSPTLSSKDLTAAMEKMPNLHTLYVPCGYSIDTTLLVSLLGRLGERVKRIYSETPLVINSDSRMFLTVDDFAKLRSKVLFPVPGPWATRPYSACARDDGYVIHTVPNSIDID
ncbi:hypothetical protein ID866_10802 [Astraeus odoratus]|nr:hypothetical protein ID866_10802 [Astraeus odoratus]